MTVVAVYAAVVKPDMRALTTSASSVCSAILTAAGKNADLMVVAGCAARATTLKSAQVGGLVS